VKYKYLIPLLAVLFNCCTSIGENRPAVTRYSDLKLMSLDEAIDAAVSEIEFKVIKGTEIVVYKIIAPSDEIGEYLSEDINDRFVMNGKLITLAREAALNYVDTEHMFQMSGLVSDASAVGIGHYLGAKVVIIGTFNRYEDFSQLRLRAVDVRTSALVASYTSRIQNADPVLANITASLGNTLVRISENALEHLNRGRDMFAEGKLNMAIQEFDRAIAIDRGLADAYIWRANSYYSKNDYNKTIADCIEAIKLNSNTVFVYITRGLAYEKKQEFYKAIDDYSQAIRLRPNDADMYFLRGSVYKIINNYDRAIDDYTEAIRFNPNYITAYILRASTYHSKGDLDRAIAEYTQIIRLDYNNADVYIGRAYVYGDKGDIDRAIADFTQAIRLAPDSVLAYNNRGIGYAMKGEYDLAILDWEAVLRIDPNNTTAIRNIERAQRATQR
jgi:tetratricopeptide (TPR) repeat protein